MNSSSDSVRPSSSPHTVDTGPGLLLVRVDENLCFANAGPVEDFILEALTDAPDTRHVILIASAVNAIDVSALEMLQGLIKNLRTQGITLHLTEVKGPVMDRLERIGLPDRLSPGRVFLHTHQAVQALTDPAAPCPGSSHCPDRVRT